jgi:hypothetical protein
VDKDDEGSDCARTTAGDNTGRPEGLINKIPLVLPLLPPEVDNDDGGAGGPDD